MHGPMNVKGMYTVTMFWKDLLLPSSVSVFHSCSLQAIEAVLSGKLVHIYQNSTPPSAPQTVASVSYKCFPVMYFLLTNLHT